MAAIVAMSLLASAGRPFKGSFLIQHSAESAKSQINPEG